MRKFLDTSNLITYQSGCYKGKIDWKSNIGKKLYFEYDDISGHIEILDYKRQNSSGYITIKYQDNITTTGTPNLLHLKIPSFNKEKQTKKYKYNVGDIVHKFNDSIQIIDQIRILYNNSSCRGYTVKCLDCNYVYNVREENISTCPICGERTSYSERFVHSILIQSDISFIPQMEFQWLYNRYYDVYLPDYNSIIEIHGRQHYKPTKINWRNTPEEIYKMNLEIDKLKHNTAITNGLTYYIINASELDDLFQESKNTLTFIDFSNISEIECEKFANYKTIISECELWNQGYSLEEIQIKLCESIQSIQSKLRLGYRYDMCNYNKNINMHFHKVTNTNRSNNTFLPSQK